MSHLITRRRPVERSETQWERSGTGRSGAVEWRGDEERTERGVERDGSEGDTVTRALANHPSLVSLLSPFPTSLTSLASPYVVPEGPARAAQTRWTRKWRKEPTRNRDWEKRAEHNQIRTFILPSWLLPLWPNRLTPRDRGVRWVKGTEHRWNDGGSGWVLGSFCLSRLPPCRLVPRLSFIPAGGLGEGSKWKTRDDKTSGLLTALTSVPWSSCSVHRVSFPPSLRPPSHSIRLRHVVESERSEHGTEWPEVNETRGQQNQGSKIDRRDGFSVFLPSRPRSAPPHTVPFRFTVVSVPFAHSLRSSHSLHLTPSEASGTEWEGAEWRRKVDSERMTVNGT